MSELATAVFAAGPARTCSTRRARAASLRSGGLRRGGVPARPRRARLSVDRARRSAFPPRLRAIHDPPPGLFVRGRRRLDARRPSASAIVGARACSAYGTTSRRRSRAARGGRRRGRLGPRTRRRRGGASRRARDAATTVAVLGCGIDRDYPRAHAALAAQIATRGLIVSEYPPGVEPAPWRFPARNRIVAGPRARDGRRRGARAERRAHHRRPRARRGPRGAGGPRRDHLAALARHEHAAAARRDTGHLRGRRARCARRRAASRRRAPVPSRVDRTSPCRSSRPSTRHRRRDRAAHAASTAAAVAAALAELELLGLVTQADGLYREVMPRHRIAVVNTTSYWRFVPAKPGFCTGKSPQGSR